MCCTQGELRVRIYSALVGDEFFFLKPPRKNVENNIFHVPVETRKTEVYHIKMNTVIYIQKLLF